VLVIIASFTGQDHAHAPVQILALLLSVVIFFSIPLILRLTLREVRVDQQAISAVGELIHLRRWPEAAVSLQALLSRSAKTFQHRTESLLYLAAVLARYHRFDDAISVQNYILENDFVSPSTAYGVKLGRTMAMLHEDHLFDADRAISDLRRTGPADSAGFLLVDMYRDVKTGHPLDALCIFDDKLPVLREQLGHRLGDVYALAARAYDLLDRKTEAADAFARATLLEPLVELCRRYPEVQKLVGRYDPAPAPPEMA
jgi:hypothetical protein